MKNSAAALPGMGQHVLIRGPVRAGLDLLRDVGPQRLGPRQSPGEVEPVRDAAPVGFGREIVREDRRVL